MQERSLRPQANLGAEWDVRGGLGRAMPGGTRQIMWIVTLLYYRGGLISWVLFGTGYNPVHFSTRLLCQLQKWARKPDGELRVGKHLCRGRGWQTMRRAAPELLGEVWENYIQWAALTHSVICLVVLELFLILGAFSLLQVENSALETRLKSQSRLLGNTQ